MGEKTLYCNEYSRMIRRVCYIVWTNEESIVSILYFALNTNTCIVFAIGDLLVSAADWIIDANSGILILKVETVDISGDDSSVQNSRETLLHVNRGGYLYCKNIH